MALKGTRGICSRSSDFYICVSDYSCQVPSGTIEHSGSGDYLDFQGLNAMLNAIEDKLNESGFPQAAMALRSWDLPGDPKGTPAHKPESEVATCSPSGEKAATDQSGPGVEHYAYGPSLASFVLRVQFRQNASWQGNLSWLEGKRAIAFRSVLELIGLIDGALQCSGDQESAIKAGRPEYRWKKKESVS